LNRRDFFRVSLGQKHVLEVDCQRLYMRYVDSRAEGTAEELLARFSEELLRASEVRLHQHSWVAYSELQGAVSTLLERFRSRGGVVEYR
jgi:hypothetical protein